MQRPVMHPVFRAEDVTATKKKAPKWQVFFKTRIVGGFKGWEKGTPFTLDNGQIWKIESDSAYYPEAPDNAHVTIERGFFGSYWMKVDTISRKIKVRRVS